MVSKGGTQDRDGVVYTCIVLSLHYTSALLYKLMPFVIIHHLIVILYNEQLRDYVPGTHTPHSWIQ